MDDEPLVTGKDYLVKIGTKTISGIITKIDYAVDVNSGEHISAESLSKNGIAVCEIRLTEGVVADKFSSHKTLGELILIDRVTNMTSACGVVEEVGEKVNSHERASFRSGELTARGDIFEEFFYDASSLNVLKYQPVHRTYTVGDEIPLSGESYSYPESFDILVLRDRVAVKVRNGKIDDILAFADYSYIEYPVINGRGFEIKVSSDEEVRSFLAEYAPDNADYFNKWMKFDTYRKVVFSK